MPDDVTRQPDSADDLRRQVPRTDAVLADERLTQLRLHAHPRVLKAAVQRAQERVRNGELDPSLLIDAVLADVPYGSSMHPVLNATGVVLHTNLGRAPLSRAAILAITESAGYVDVEFDTGTGRRATRGRGALDALRARVPDAGDVLVVNNGAAALVLAAMEVARGGEIIVSRGELVEIGDGFRIPQLIESTGARLCEVGTTNRTHLGDYQEAIGPRTAFILKVHPSNFEVRGFVSDVGIAHLAGLGVPVIGDIGSGLLEPHPLLPREPDAASWLRAGAALVTASGDKLLGGPQAGLVLGRADLVQRLRRHPMYRALRVDKLTLAALEATLVSATTLAGQALDMSAGRLRQRADRLAGSLAEAGVDGRVVASPGLVGGGGAPGRILQGWAVELPQRFAALLRVGDPCVVARVEADCCLLDLRCVPEEDDDGLVAAVLAVADR